MKRQRSDLSRRIRRIRAEIMCGHWKERSQEIYSFVMRSLMRSE